MKHHSHSDQVSRRKFLGEASCAGIGMTSLLSSVLNLRLAGTLSAADAPGGDEDYKALVCVFLAGGNDSFNMLAPVSGDARAAYEASRREIALAVDRFEPFSEALTDGRLLGVPKEMSELSTLYEAGKAAFVANVGTLVEPTSLDGINMGTAKLPKGLFSHSDQSRHWHSGMPETRSPEAGWVGRMADLLTDLNGESKVSMNVSLSGINLLQSGPNTSVFSLGTDGAPSLRDWNEPSFIPRRTALENMIDANHRSVFERAYSNLKKGALEETEEFRVAFESATDFSNAFGTSDLSQQLRVVAETISTRTALCKRRQTFFVVMGGWDHHFSLGDHPEMLRTLSQSIGEFQSAIEGLMLSDQVTLFTASDFGRTLAPNGGGSDHAWGGNQIVVGGAVNGKNVYGTYPDIALGSALDSGRGRLIPTTSVDEYFADLALWMGVAPANLGMVLPNLHRFHNVVDDGPPIGFMQPPPA